MVAASVTGSGWRRSLRYCPRPSVEAIGGRRSYEIHPAKSRRVRGGLARRRARRLAPRRARRGALGPGQGAAPLGAVARRRDRGPRRAGRHPRAPQRHLRRRGGGDVLHAARQDAAGGWRGARPDDPLWAALARLASEGAQAAGEHGMLVGVPGAAARASGASAPSASSTQTSRTRRSSWTTASCSSATGGCGRASSRTRAARGPDPGGIAARSPAFVGAVTYRRDDIGDDGRVPYAYVPAPPSVGACDRRARGGARRTGRRPRPPRRRRRRSGPLRRRAARGTA